MHVGAGWLTWDGDGWEHFLQGPVDEGGGIFYGVKVVGHRVAREILAAATLQLVEIEQVLVDERRIGDPWRVAIEGPLGM
jgi:hypothetical protein